MYGIQGEGKRWVSGKKHADISYLTREVNRRLLMHGSYRFHNFLFKDFSRTFNDIQGVRFIMHSQYYVVMPTNQYHQGQIMSYNQRIIAIPMYKESFLQLFHCCFCVFHFSCVISRHSRPCLKCQ